MVEEVSRLLSQARGAYQREQYQVALAYFQQACQVDSHSPEALLGLGEVSSFLGFRDQAINAFLSLADLYLRAAMFEVGAEVIERILDLDPQNDVALRFQRFIQRRLRPSPTDQITAVTVVERPPVQALSRDSEQMPTVELAWDYRQPTASRELDDLIDNIATPLPIDDVARAQTELAPRELIPPPQSRFRSTLTGVEELGDDDEEDSQVRTKTFDAEYTDLDAIVKKPEVVFDFGDEDDDLVSYTDLDPDAASPEELFARDRAPSPADTIESPGEPSPADTMSPGEPAPSETVQTALEIPKAREIDPIVADDDDASTQTEPARDDISTGPAPRVDTATATAETTAASDSAETRAEPPSGTRDEGGVPEPERRDIFADVQTRAVPEEMLEVLAKTDGDPFSSDTVEGDVALVERRLETPGERLPDTAVSKPSAALLAAAGTDSYPPVDSWDVNTEAAVVAENLRKRPAISIDADDEQLDLADFPSFEEQDNQEPRPVTHTIALEHKDTIMSLEELAPISAFIGQLTPDQRVALVQDGAILQCFSGQVVCREGDRGRDLYLLVSGQAAVERIAGSGSPQRIASLSPGAFFGEGSVLADAPRSTTVRIIDDALLIEIERSRLQALVKQRPQLLTVLTRFLRARMVSSLMMSSPLFFGLDMDERAALAPLLHLHKLNPGQQVVKRGQLLTGYCTLMAGELERFDFAEGTGKQVFGPLQVGDSFGIDCLHRKPSALSIGAVTGAWLMRLPTANLRELINQHPELLEALTEADLLV